MKSIACYTLHYGSDYLAWSVRSVMDVVDELHFIYSEKPSFGYHTSEKNPDTEEMLFAEAKRFVNPNKQFHWHKIDGLHNEGQHRDNFYNIARSKGAELLVVVDADEIWDSTSLEHTIKYIWDSNNTSKWLANFANFWQSWKWQVHDHFKPVRFVDLRWQVTPTTHNGIGQQVLTNEQQPEPVFHFGYAQREALMRYKWCIHGHQSELRPGWVDGKFFGWHPEMTDLHPCVNNLWDKAHSTDPHVSEMIHKILHDHPYKNKDLIR